MKTRKSIRIYITEKCNANCPNCFNASSRTNSEIDVKTFNNLCLYLKRNGIKKIKILGGEPTVHPEFKEIIRLAQRHFEYLGIFTNGLIDCFYDIEFRDTDSLIFNFKFIDIQNPRVYHFEKKGTRVLEIQVTKDSNPNEIIDRIQRFSNEEKKKLLCNLTLDCKSNIFKERSIILPKLHILESEFKKQNTMFSYDHKIPLCYLYKSGIHVHNLGICNKTSAGIIDSSLNLRFCLQNTEILIPLIRGNEFIPWKIIENNLEKKYLELRQTSLEKICSSCIFYGDKCNGGCWIPQDFISKEDILFNTDFPILRTPPVSDMNPV